MSKKLYQELLQMRQECLDKIDDLVQVYGVERVQEKLVKLEKELLSE